MSTLCAGAKSDLHFDDREEGAGEFLRVGKAGEKKGAEGGATEDAHLSKRKGGRSGEQEVSLGKERHSAGEGSLKRGVQTHPPKS